MRFSELVLTLREKIEPKLIYSPFLRLIIFNVWFLLGFAAFMLTLIAAALYLPKMWRVTPAGFEPIVRISGLDMTQSWALKRSARKLEAQNMFEGAAEAWQGAIAQNPGDADALHSALENVMRVSRPDNRLIAKVVPQMTWLLRLNNTNTADVDLVARVCDKLGLYDLAAYLLGPVDRQNLPGAAQAVLIKNDFHQNRIEAFLSYLDTQGPKLKDPELPYYRLAYEAGWRQTANSAQALAALEKATESPEGSHRMGHLLLRAAAQKGDVALYARELEKLGRKNEASAGDHALYWTLLAAKGQTNEAIKLAQSAGAKPASAGELIRIAQSYLTLGLLDPAAELMKEMAPRYAGFPEVWITYANILYAKQDWDGLRSAARIIRSEFTARETLWGLSYLLEGRAELEQNREAAAQVAFDQAAQSTYDYPTVALVVGNELSRVRQPQRALRVFAAVESTFKDDSSYWSSVYAAAFAAQDAEALLKSTENAHRLLPNDIARINNFAAALLVTQQRPEEAIKLTLQLYSRFPQSAAALINHSCALLLNGRVSEARSLIESVNPQAIGPAERSQYNLTLFETYHALKLWDQAREARKGVLESNLFPVQRERLRQKEEQMPKIEGGLS